MIEDPSSLIRCPWCGTDPLYLKYHDEEWGVPVHEDTRHFEFLLLESMQAGLSWLTVLKKREHFRKAFAGFNPQKVTAFDNRKIESLLRNTGIIRNRAKITAVVLNARHFLEIRAEYGSFDRYIWDFVDHKPLVNHWGEASEVPANTPLSDLVSKDLKQRGFKFLGTTIIYSYLQAVGLINDHLTSCFRWKQLHDLQKKS